MPKESVRNPRSASSNLNPFRIVQLLLFKILYLRFKRKKKSDLRGCLITLLLALQFALQPILTRYCSSQFVASATQGEQSVARVLVVATELLKMFISISILLLRGDGWMLRSNQAFWQITDGESTISKIISRPTLFWIRK